jgi:hypothetical protein
VRDDKTKRGSDSTDISQKVKWDSGSDDVASAVRNAVELIKSGGLTATYLVPAQLVEDTCRDAGVEPFGERVSPHAYSLDSAEVLRALRLAWDNFMAGEPDEETVRRARAACVLAALQFN